MLPYLELLEIDKHDAYFFIIKPLSDFLAVLFYNRQEM